MATVGSFHILWKPSVQWSDAALAARDAKARKSEAVVAAVDNFDLSELSEAAARIANAISWNDTDLQIVDFEDDDDDDDHCEEDVDWYAGDCDDELDDTAYTAGTPTDDPELLEQFDGNLEDADASASQVYASASRSFQEARELFGSCQEFPYLLPPPSASLFSPHTHRHHHQAIPCHFKLLLVVAQSVCTAGEEVFMTRLADMVCFVPFRSCLWAAAGFDRQTQERCVLHDGLHLLCGVSLERARRERSRPAGDCVMCSLAALCSSEFIGRWLAVSLRFRHGLARFAVAVRSALQSEPKSTEPVGGVPTHEGPLTLHTKSVPTTGCLLACTQGTITSCHPRTCVTSYVLGGGRGRGIELDRLVK